MGLALRLNSIPRPPIDSILVILYFRASCIFHSSSRAPLLFATFAPYSNSSYPGVTLSLNYPIPELDMV